MRNVVANGVFAGKNATQGRPGGTGLVPQSEFQQISISIHDSAGSDGLQLLGGRIVPADPGHPEFSLFHGNPANRLQHRLGVFFPHNGLVDITQQGIDAVELLNVMFRLFALHDVPRTVHNADSFPRLLAFGGCGCRRLG